MASTLSNTASLISSQQSTEASTQTAAANGSSSDNSASLGDDVDTMMKLLETDLGNMQVACSAIKYIYEKSYLASSKDSDAVKSLMKDKIRRGYIGE